MKNEQIRIYRIFRIYAGRRSEIYAWWYDIGWHIHEAVLREADEVGRDALNACIGGLVEFEKFIGLNEEEESVT